MDTFCSVNEYQQIFPKISTRRLDRFRQRSLDQCERVTPLGAGMAVTGVAYSNGHSSLVTSAGRSAFERPNSKQL